MQDRICDTLGTLSVQSHAVRTLQCTGHLREVDGSSPTRVAVVPLPFGTTFDDALEKLSLIFERLRSYGLQLKSTKCHLFQTSVPFLGHVVGRGGLECDPRKITDVKSWPVPDCLKSVRQFLGFVGYYMRFIPQFC